MRHHPARGRFTPDQLPDAEAMFWATARDAAADTKNGHKLFATLLRQFRSVRPTAGGDEFEAARKRLAALCGVA